MPKFSAFSAALLKLCEQHAVALAVTDDDNASITVRDKRPNTAHFAPLVDGTETPTAEPGRRMAPDIFSTLVEARAHPGFVAHELAERFAKMRATQVLGATVVPVGDVGRIRAWAVIKPSVA